MRSRLPIILVCLPLISSSCEKSLERVDLSKYVSIYPGAPVFEIPGDSKEMQIVVRNVSAVKLTDLRLEVKTKACQVKIPQGSFKELIPGDRHVFHAHLTRDKTKQRHRYPLLITLHATGLPVSAGLDLMVDLSPAPEKGWITVGTVQLVSRPPSKTLYYYLLAGAPLLFLLGWLLWRWSRPTSEAPPTEPTPRE